MNDMKIDDGGMRIMAEMDHDSHADHADHDMSTTMDDHDMSDMGGGGMKMEMDHSMDMGGMQMYMYWNTKVTFLVKGSFYSLSY